MRPQLSIIEVIYGRDFENRNLPIYGGKDLSTKLMVKILGRKT
jgi:hypothetical protein